MKRTVTSKAECSQPATLLWTSSGCAVLDMLNSFQLTQAEETKYEITTKNRALSAKMKCEYIHKSPVLKREHRNG